MLRYDGEEDQIGIAVVDKAVRVAFRAVVTLAGGDALLAVREQHLATALKEIHNLAARLVRMQADRSARLEAAVHDAVLPVEKHAGDVLFLAALEVRQALFWEAEEGSTKARRHWPSQVGTLVESRSAWKVPGVSHVASTPVPAGLLWPALTTRGWVAPGA